MMNRNSRFPSRQAAIKQNGKTGSIHGNLELSLCLRGFHRRKHCTNHDRLWVRDFRHALFSLVFAAFAILRAFRHHQHVSERVAFLEIPPSRRLLLHVATSSHLYRRIQHCGLAVHTGQYRRTQSLFRPFLNSHRRVFHLFFSVNSPQAQSGNRYYLHHHFRRGKRLFRDRRAADGPVLPGRFRRG